MQTLQEIFDLAIAMGLKNDPRKKDDIKEFLKEQEKAYKKLDKQKQKYFDKERFKHPFSDSRVLFGDPKAKIKKIAVGIDIETPELLLVNELNKSGDKIDAVMAHHPEGRALLGLTGVMRLQEDIFEELGVAPNVAEKLLAPRMAEIDRSLHSINAFRE